MDLHFDQSVLSRLCELLSDIDSGVSDTIQEPYAGSGMVHLRFGVLVYIGRWTRPTQSKSGFK